MTDNHLTNPKHGEPIETEGMPVTRTPIPGGVVIMNASVPADHEAAVVYRELNDEEKKQQKAEIEGGVAFNRANARVFLRMTRDAMLTATDYLENDEDKKWAIWRQKLRDLPAKVKNPENPKWPTPPRPVSQLLPYRSYWPKLNWKRYQ